MRMKKLLTFLTLLTLSIGVTWAAEVTDTWTASSGAIAASTSGTISTTGGKTWNFTRNTVVYTGWTSNCIQLGSKSGAETVTFSSSAYGTSTIKSVSVECASYQGAHKVSISVGGNTYLASTATSSWTTVETKTGTGTSSGQIVISFTNGSRALYIKSISVTYEENGTTPEPTTYELTLPTGLTGGTVTATGYSDLTAIPSGTSMTVTATPSTGYALDWMKANGTEVQNPYTFAIAENTTITASFVQEQASTTQWVLTSPSNLTTGDVVLIVDKYSSRAMSNDKGTSNPPSATSVVLNTEKTLVTSGANDNLQWLVTKNSAELILGIPPAGTTHLYCTNTNNGVRVGSGDNDRFNITNDYLYNIGTGRYLGVYNNQDWRCYTSTGGNIANTQVAFYKKVEAGAHSISVGTITGEGTITSSSGSANTGDQITVTATPATGYELTALAYNGTAIDITSTPYTFTMPDADVTLTATFSAINYNIYRTITAQNPNDQGGWIGNWNENCNLPDGAQGTDYTVTSTYGKEVQFKAGNNEGYKILAENVSAKDANNNNVPLTVVSSDNSGIVFKFNMPASNVTISAYFTFYQPDLYLMGTANDQNWQQTYKMTYSNDQYTIRAYFAGQSASDPYGYFQFEGDGTRYASGAEGEYWPISENGTGESHFGDQVPLYANSSKNFRVPAGIYDIVINKDRNKVTVNPVAVNISFLPTTGSTVDQGTNVTTTSNLYNLLHTINSEVSESSVSNQVSLDGNNFNNSVALTTIGSQTVTGKASYKQIAITGSAAYTVVAANTNTQYQLITSTNDLIAGKKYIIVSTGSYTASGTTYNFTKAAGALSGVLLSDVDVTIDENDIIDLASTSGVTEFKLGGTTDAWTFAFSDGTLLTSTTSKQMSATADGTPAIISFDGDEATIDMGTVGNLQYNPNSGNGRFTTYTSVQKPVMLFKQVEGTVTQKSAAPVITPESGNIVGFSQEVEITQSNGGNIYYTIDGTTPDENSTPYNGKFWAEGENLGDEVTITAVAKEEGKELSNPVSVTYKFIAPATPTFSPQGGTYTSYQYVELASATEGADVYYTTDGSNPSVNNGTKYTEPIAVTENVTIKAITVYHDAHVNKDATSGSRQAKYTIVTDGIVEVENIAEFNAIQPDENDEYPEVRFKNPVTVLYDYSQRSYSSQLQETTYQEYIWVKDESGFTQIFLRPSLNSNNDEDHQIAFYENGDVIPGGFVVRKQYYETGEYYQAYSDKAGTDPTLPGSNVTAGFAEATQKALADPEPMTAAQLADLTPSDENIANYNNRYIRISKIKVTSISTDGKNFDFEDENGYGSNIAGYNKYSDATSYMKGGETLVTETINFPQTASNTTYYDVTAILCTWKNGWEIMPISFTPWQANELTLRELCADGVENNEYTISNNLMCVFAKGNSIWVKDDDGQAIVKYAPNDEYPDNFAIEAEGNTRLDQQYYDQSNWCEIQLTSENAGDFVGKIIKGGSINGTFSNKTNPTMTGVTLTSGDIYSDGSYSPNYYMPANFFGNQSCQTSQHGQPGHGDFFFMTPKPQEYATIVWAIWDSDSQKMVITEDPNKNSHQFKGSFSINLNMNSGITDPEALHDGMDDGFAYNFNAIIRVNSSKAGSDFMVYPLDLSAATDPATAIESVEAGKGEVKSVKYVNVAGVASDAPFQGVNIVVTEYTDGTRTTSKMLRK